MGIVAHVFLSTPKAFKNSSSLKYCSRCSLSTPGRVIEPCSCAKLYVGLLPVFDCGTEGTTVVSGGCRGGTGGGICRDGNGGGGGGGGGCGCGVAAAFGKEGVLAGGSRVDGPSALVFFELVTLNCAESIDEDEGNGICAANERAALMVAVEGLGGRAGRAIP